MGTPCRAVTALLLILPLSCAGPLEEAGGLRAASDEADVPTTAPTLVVRRAPGEPPLEVSEQEAAHALQLLSSQLHRVEAEPELARRRMLADVELPPELEGLLLDPVIQGRVVPASADLTEAQRKQMTDAYFQHCKETHGRWGDCLHAMNGERLLTGMARRRIACHFALASVWDGMKKELEGMLDPDRIENAIIFGFATWAVLVALPEPFSKFLAVGLTVAMTAWMGLDALENVIGGWKEMAAAVDGATTFLEIRQAGATYGTRMGEQTLRLVVMLVASAIGERGLANLPRLPKFNLATQRLAAATGGPGLEVVGAAQQATVTGSRITVVLAKAAKGVQAGVAALAGGANGISRECREEEHHIATVENEKATWNGGPWTLRFNRLFQAVGLSMEDKANKRRIFGHRGPHPPRYHEMVFERLSRALENCGTQAQCRKAFILELERLGGEMATPGTELNELVTRGCGKMK